METKKVTLNNGTVLEAGGKYRLDMWSDTFYVECIKIHNDKCVMMEIDELEDICLFVYDFNRDWLPYTPPTPQKEWKTFMIEIDWNGYTTREIVQCESLEIAERHYNGAISIIEVKLNIEPVNS